MTPDRLFTFSRLSMMGVLLGLIWCMISPVTLYFDREVFRLATFEKWDNLLYDLKIRHLSRPQMCNQIVHVDIDDDAIEKLGQWPWDRKISADIVDRLTTLGARAVVFDILYTTKGKSHEGDQALAKAISAAGNVTLATSPIKMELPKPSSTAKKGGGVALEIDEGASRRADMLYDRSWKLHAGPEFSFYQMSELRNSGLPLPALIKSAYMLGHIKDTSDKDGVYRKVPLVIKLVDRFVPSLSLAGLVTYLKLKPDKIKLDRAGYLEVKHSDGTITIPVDYNACMSINWAPPRKRFQHDPVLTLFTKDFQSSLAGRYKDKIVIVGAAWTGMTDIVSSPVDPKVPGSTVHSSALYTMLSGKFIRQVRPFPLVVGCTLIVSLAFIWFAAWHPIPFGIRLAGVILVSFASIVIVAFFAFSLHIPFVQPVLVFFPAAMLVLGFRSVSTERERQNIRDMFGRYVSEEIVSEILEGKITIKGELREITALVCDLRGFTAMTASLKPSVVLEIINRYFECMTDIIMSHEGTIDTFTGDGILVFFGAPRHQPDHARCAIECALEMQMAMVPFNEECRSLSQPELQMGIGINTGEVVLGNIGSEKRRSYTAIGGPINIAFRVEAQTAGGEILITPSVYDKVAKSVEVASERDARLKGIPEPIRLYSITGLRNISQPPQ
jgi:adenylate cyclase